MSSMSIDNLCTNFQKQINLDTDSDFVDLYKNDKKKEFKKILWRKMDECGVAGGLEWAIDKLQDCDKKKLMLVLTFHSDEVGKKLKKDFSKLEMKHEIDSVDVRSLHLLAMQKIFSDLGNTQFVPKLIDQFLSSDSTPPLFQKKMRLETPYNSLTNLYKFTQRQNHNWTLVKFEGTHFQRLYVKGNMIGNGTYKKISRLIQLGGRSKPVVLAQPNLNFCPKNCTLEKWEGQLQNMIAYECMLSKFFQEKEVPGIIKIWKVTYCRSDGKNCVGAMMEYCDMGDMHDVIINKKIVDPVVRMELALQGIRACKGMHDLEICHDDLKPENFFLKCNGRDKSLILLLGDLANAKKVGEVTANYSSFPPPEMMRAIKELNTKVAITKNMDCWALGGFLSHMKYGHSLLNVYNLGHQCAENEYTKFKENLLLLQKDMEELANSGDTIDQCIAQLLSLDPEKRPSLDKVEKVIEEWLQKQKIEE